MSVYAVGSVWICSIFATGGIGWLLGRGYRPDYKMHRPMGWTLGGFDYPSQPSDEEREPSRSLSELDPPLPVKAPVEETLPARARHILHQMPPVEAVREQAKAIREAESVWDMDEAALSTFTPRSRESAVEALHELVARNVASQNAKPRLTGRAQTLREEDIPSYSTRV